VRCTIHIYAATQLPSCYQHTGDLGASHAVHWRKASDAERSKKQLTLVHTLTFSSPLHFLTNYFPHLQKWGLHRLTVRRCWTSHQRKST